MDYGVGSITRYGFKAPLPEDVLVAFEGGAE